MAPRREFPRRVVLEEERAEDGEVSVLRGGVDRRRLVGPQPVRVGAGFHERGGRGRAAVVGRDVERARVRVEAGLDLLRALLERACVKIKLSAGWASGVKASKL